eukprot:300600-Rhodomonas_salina.1
MLDTHVRNACKPQLLSADPIPVRSTPSGKLWCSHTPPTPQKARAPPQQPGGTVHCVSSGHHMASAEAGGICNLHGAVNSSVTNLRTNLSLRHLQIVSHRENHLDVVIWVFAEVQQRLTGFAFLFYRRHRRRISHVNFWHSLLWFCRRRKGKRGRSARQEVARGPSKRKGAAQGHKSLHVCLCVARVLHTHPTNATVIDDRNFLQTW